MGAKGARVETRTPSAGPAHSFDPPDRPSSHQTAELELFSVPPDSHGLEKKVSDAPHFRQHGASDVKLKVGNFIFSHLKRVTLAITVRKC